MTDDDGNRIAEIDTSKYGDPYCKHILFDGRPSRVQESAAFDEENEITEITTLNGYAFPEEAEGAVLRAADANGAWTAIVTAVDGNSILIDDPGFAVLDAVGAGADFVIFDNRMGSVSGGANLGGTWDGAAYNSGPDTSLIDADDAFDDYIEGWHVQIDASVPVYFEILSVSGDHVTVAGDVTGLITAGETNFMIIHPVGVDPETGTTQEDPCVPESRYIWGGGLYLSPIAGFNTGGEIQGAQTGSNMSGQHYMWNRVYDINTGRWTTPDPAAQPWWNLNSYVSQNPLRAQDPSGLFSVHADPLEHPLIGDDVDELLRTGTPPTENHREWWARYVKEKEAERQAKREASWRAWQARMEQERLADLARRRAEDRIRREMERSVREQLRRIEENLNRSRRAMGLPPRRIYGSGSSVGSGSPSVDGSDPRPNSGNGGATGSRRCDDWNFCCVHNLKTGAYARLWIHLVMTQTGCVVCFSPSAVLAEHVRQASCSLCYTNMLKAGADEALGFAEAMEDCCREWVYE